MRFTILENAQVNKIKYPRKFIRQFINCDSHTKIVDIWSNDDKTMWIAYEYCKDSHIMWKYTFSFKYENVSYMIELM